MKKYEIIKNNEVFNNIIKNGINIKNKYFVIYKEVNSLSYPQFGIAVGTKIGNAVTRNYYKRQIRSIIDKNKKSFSKSYKYIIIMKKETINLTFLDKTNKLISLLRED